MKQRKPRPPPQTRQESLRKELQINDPAWSGLADDTKRARACEINKNKEMVIAQFVVESKPGIPVTKNQYLRMVYRVKFDNSKGDGYNSDFTANSEGIFQLNVNSAVFDTTADDNSNGEIILEESDLNINAAVAEKQRPSILKGNRRKNFKSSEMPAGVIPKMMVTKQLKMMNGEKVAAYMTYSAKMANIDFYSCYDSLVPDKEPVKDVDYKVNLLLHTEEPEYRVNLSKQDRIVGGKHLALADSGANGLIIGLGMKILYFNNDGKRVSIEISGDHQLTGKKIVLWMFSSQINCWVDQVDVTTRSTSEDTTEFHYINCSNAR